MSTFMNNWLLRRAMSAPRGGGGDDVVIPTVYQRVEYLESTANGRQYIKTNIVPTATSGMKVKCASNSSNDLYIAGQRNDTLNTRWVLGCDNHYYFGWGVWNSETTFHTGYQNTVELELNYKNSGVASCDDEVIPLSPLTFQPERPIFVFGSNTGGSLYLPWVGKIYDLEITEGSNIVMHLIPCYRKSDGKPGMWDMVSWQFFTNAGSGADFTVGPDVVQPATKYIVFEDRAVEAICVQNFSSDGIGVTMQDAAGPFSASLQSGLFNGNTQIVSFEELQYFTGYALQGDRRLTSFICRDATNLKRVICPSGIYLDVYMFSGCALDYIEFLGDPQIYYDDQVLNSSSSGVTIVFRGTNPPTFRQSCFRGLENVKVYVPYSSDHSVLSAYQTALTYLLNNTTNQLYELNHDGTIPS